MNYITPPSSPTKAKDPEVERNSKFSTPINRGQCTHFCGACYCILDNPPNINNERLYAKRSAKSVENAKRSGENAKRSGENANPNHTRAKPKPLNV